MRLFIALDIDQDIRERIARFVAGVQNFAPNARWVTPESMHVTLKFLGEQPDTAVENIKAALKTVEGKRPTIQFRGHGFFPHFEVRPSFLDRDGVRTRTRWPGSRHRRKDGFGRNS